MNKKAIFCVLILGAVLTSLMATVMSTTLPVIMETFRIPASQAQMVTSIYSLVSGITIIATAVLIKKVPTRRLFLISMGIFSIGILLCALSPNFLILLLGRIIQGAGYGILISMTQVVILTIISKNKIGFAMGIYRLAVVFAPVLGPIIAGVIIDHTSWKLIFWLVLILCVITLVLGLIFMRNVLDNSEQTLDLPSMILSSIGFAGLVLATGNMGSYAFISLQVGLLFLIGIVALMLFAKRQFTMEKPLLNLRVFSDKNFTVSVIVSILLYALLNAMSSIMPILIQTVMGKSATKFGLTVAPCALLQAAFSPFTGKLYDKKGLRMLAVAGSILVLVSNGAVLFVTESTPVGILMLLMGMLGIGLSGMQMNIVTYGMKNMTGNDKTDGTAILSCLRTMGSALGTAIFVSIMAMGASDNQYKIGDIHRTYLYMTITSAAVLVIALIFIKNTKKEDLKTL